jgi:hypothetical protein
MDENGDDENDDADHASVNTVMMERAAHIRALNGSEEDCPGSAEELLPSRYLGRLRRRCFHDPHCLALPDGH